MASPEMELTTTIGTTEVGPPSIEEASDGELRDRIYLLTAQLKKCQEDTESMRAAFTRRSALCRQEVTTVVHEYVSTGNAGNDFSKNQAIGRYVNFINAVTDGATTADMEMRIEETARMFSKYNVNGRAASGSSSGFGTEQVSEDLTDTAALGQTLDRIVELRNDRDEIKHRLDTLHIRYTLLVEKLKGKEVAHARITKELEHRCEALGRHQLTLNRTIEELEAKLQSLRKDNVLLRRSFEQQKRDADMEKELTNAQIAQLEMQLRAELLKREPHSAGKLNVVEYACDIMLEGDGGPARNPSREMLERLSAECALPIAFPPLSADDPFVSATASKALQDRINDMAADISVWRMMAVTAQSEKNKAEAYTITLNEELSRIQEAAKDRQIDLPFDRSEARARAALHSPSDDRSNFKEMTRTLRAESLEAAKRISRLRRDLERLVVPGELIKAREEASEAEKNQAASHGDESQSNLFKDLGSVSEETELLEALESDIRQSLVDNIMWRKAAQRDLAIAHGQLLAERSIWVQQWSTLLDGLPPEVAGGIRTEGLASLAGDASVAALVSLVDQSRKYMVAEAIAAATIAEEALKASKQLKEGGCQTEEEESITLKERSEIRNACSRESDVVSLKIGVADAVTQTSRRWYTNNLNAQRVNAGGGLALDSDDDEGNTFDLTNLKSQMARQPILVDMATSPRGTERSDTATQHQIDTHHVNVGTLPSDFLMDWGTQTQIAVSASIGVGVMVSQSETSSQCQLLDDLPSPVMAETAAQTEGPSVRSVAIGNEFSFLELQKSEIYKHAHPMSQETQTDEPPKLPPLEVQTQTEPLAAEVPPADAPKGSIEEEPLYDYVEKEAITTAEIETQTDTDFGMQSLRLDNQPPADSAAPILPASEVLPLTHSKDSEVQTVILGWDMSEEVRGVNWFADNATEHDDDTVSQIGDKVFKANVVEGLEPLGMIKSVPSTIPASDETLIDLYRLQPQNAIENRVVAATLKPSPQRSFSRVPANIFMFESAIGPTPLTRSAEVQVHIRKWGTHRDAGCQSEMHPLSLVDANTSTTSFGHLDRGTSPLHMSSASNSVRQSTPLVFRSNNPSALPNTEGDDHPSPVSLSPRSLSQSQRSPRAVTITSIRMAPYQPPVSYGAQRADILSQRTGNTEMSDAAVGPGLFWRVTDKCVGTDLDSRALRDLTITEASKSLMGVRVAQPSKQEQLAAMVEPPPQKLYDNKGHFIGNPQWHPSNRKLPRLPDPTIPLHQQATKIQPASVSVSGAIRVLEPLDMFVGGSHNFRRPPSADAKNAVKINHEVSPAPGMRKPQTPLKPLSPEDEAKAQILARSLSPPCPMFHYSPGSTQSPSQRKGRQ